MRFTLKDYQQDALEDVLARLGQAREAYRGRYSAPSAFSLTAVTGAGKTVIAAAAIEALFEGNEDFRFDPDPGAVVLWFTDDPALNEQTRARLSEATDLSSSRFQVIQPDFAEDRLKPGTVYFLNAQKLSKNSLLVRGAVESDDPALPGMKPPPDLRGHTMWDILRNTIEDEDLTLYLILDEAHKGMKRTTKSEAGEKQSIVRRLINGEETGHPIPIVWGISATVERFEEAMKEAQAGGRNRLAPVEVDAGRVQQSGLLKDDIRLDFPQEAGQFDTVLLTRAVRRTREATQLWSDYAASQDPPLDPVLPLLVVQLPNTPSDELLSMAFQTVREAWPELPDDAFAHVFGDQRTIELAGETVPHVPPEKVQDWSWIRVLFAKDAITTGWDCPRAEVLMSFRPAKDETHITQLLGRMVRTPLARRVPANDRLNSVECLLPRFSRDTAVRVGELILGRRDPGAGGSGGGDGRRTLYAPVDLAANPAIPAEVWVAFDAIPSETLPRKSASPVKRLLALAQALSRDDLAPGARGEAVDTLVDVLAGEFARHRRTKGAAAIAAVQRLEGETVVAGMSGSGEFERETFSESADRRAIEAEFAAAARVLTRELAMRLADRLEAAGDAEDLLDAHVKVAALARVSGVSTALDREAADLADHWYDRFRVEIKGLSDERQTVYREIRAMSTEPKLEQLIRPKVRSESTEDATGEKVRTVAGHLMADSRGQFPIGSLGGWEIAVLEKESTRPGFQAFYRNPDRGSADAVAVAYRAEGGGWKRIFPDFLFFHRIGAETKVSIVDPHGIHLDDALPKLRGLAEYAETYAASFHRIEAVAEVDGSLRVLDLTREGVRKAVEVAIDAAALYREHGSAY